MELGFVGLNNKLYKMHGICIEVSKQIHKLEISSFCIQNIWEAFNGKSVT